MSSSDRDRLDGRRALVTGGSKGSGKAVVERLREMGGLACCGVRGGLKLICLIGHRLSWVRSV